MELKMRKQSPSLQTLATCATWGWCSIPLSAMPTIMQRSETAGIHDRDQDGRRERSGGGVAGLKGRCRSAHCLTYAS